MVTIIQLQTQKQGQFSKSRNLGQLKVPDRNSLWCTYYKNSHHSGVRSFMVNCPAKSGYINDK